MYSNGYFSLGNQLDHGIREEKKKKGRMDDKVMLRFGYVNEDIFVRLRKRAV